MTRYGNERIARYRNQTYFLVARTDAGEHYRVRQIRAVMSGAAYTQKQNINLTTSFSDKIIVAEKKTRHLRQGIASGDKNTPASVPGFGCDISGERGQGSEYQRDDYS